MVYALKLFVKAAIVVFGVTTVSFTLLHLAPGGPAEALAGAAGGATQQMLDQIRAQYGLDNPVLVQFWNYVAKTASGDLGQSFYYNQSVLSLIVGRIGNTVLLAAAAFVVAVVGGLIAGVASSRRRHGALGRIITILALAGYSAPVFWVGLVAIVLFASVLPWFPTQGMHSIIPLAGFWPNLWDVLYHLVLPALTLGLTYLAQYSRTCRTSMIDALGSDYVRTARAKGVSEWSVTIKHALRNALLPVITLAGVQAGRMVSGAILVETVFNWPGIGNLAVKSVQHRDTPVLMGIFIISAVLIVVINILTDLSYRWVDPRIRVSGSTE